jgi:hypothetical protein
MPRAIAQMGARRRHGLSCKQAATQDFTPLHRFLRASIKTAGPSAADLQPASQKALVPLAGRRVRVAATTSIMPALGARFSSSAHRFGRVLPSTAPRKASQGAQPRLVQGFGQARGQRRRADRGKAEQTKGSAKRPLGQALDQAGKRSTTAHSYELEASVCRSGRAQQVLKSGSRACAKRAKKSALALRPGPDTEASASELRMRQPQKLMVRPRALTGLDPVADGAAWLEGYGAIAVAKRVCRALPATRRLAAGVQDQEHAHRAKAAELHAEKEEARQHRAVLRTADVRDALQHARR